MTTPKDDHWHANIKAKGVEIQGLIDQVLTYLPCAKGDNHKTFDDLLAKTIQKSWSMHDLFGPNQIPPPLAKLTDELTRWKTNVQQPAHLKRIIVLYDSLGKINGDEDGETPSFTKILEKHRDDETLQEFLSELIAYLEQLIAEGDEILTKQASDELERILDEIKKRKEMSLPDLKPWVEFSIVSVGALIDSYVGTPIATIAGGAIIAAKNSQIRINDLAAIAYNEFLESLKLKGSDKFRNGFGKRLMDDPLESIEEDVKTPGGFKGIPAPQTNTSAFKESGSPDKDQPD